MSTYLESGARTYERGDGCENRVVVALLANKKTVEHFWIDSRDLCQADLVRLGCISGGWIVWDAVEIHFKLSRGQSKAQATLDKAIPHVGSHAQKEKGYLETQKGSSSRRRPRVE